MVHFFNLEDGAFMDFRYETREESREFHRQRKSFIILKSKVEFLPYGSEMSHFEYCQTKGISKKELNEITRGYYIKGKLCSTKIILAMMKNL